MNDTLIELRNLVKIYDTGAVKVIGLNQINLQIQRGEFVAIMGQSGSGKSTLMNILGCLDKPTLGQYILDGEDVAQMDPNTLNIVRNRKIGFVFQSFNLISRMSALRNVEIPMIYAHKKSPKERRERAEMLLEKVGLGGRVHHQPNEMSGGQRQRVAIARALTNEPPLILADEPTKGLDPDVWQMVAENLHCLTQRQGVSLLLITHDIPLARRLADRVVVMQAGRITAQGRDVWSDPQFPYREGQWRMGAAAERIPAVDGPRVATHEGQQSAPEPEEEAVLAAEGVSKRMRDRMRGTWMNVLTDCSLRVAAGRTVGLEGRSGAGKSTLVRILLGLLRPDGGTVCWNGRDIRALPRIERLAFRRGVQLVVQNPEQAFDPRRSIGGSLSEVFAVHPVLLRAGADARAQIVETLSAVELTERVLTRHPHELSGGELQRAAIARALLTEPRILLLDEPTTMLDISLRAQIMELLLRLRVERGLGMLLISHERELLRDFADEIHVLEAGRVR